MRSSLRVLGTAGVALTMTAGLLAGIPAASATTQAPNRVGAAASHPWPKDPAHNIAPKPNVKSYGAAPACFGKPRSTTCSTLIVRALNHARSALNKRSYHLPSRFLSLAGTEQLLVLSNDDRRLYSEPTIRGLNGALNKNASYWAVRDQDPRGVAVVHHHQAHGFTSNWAGGTAAIANPLFAYYEWMYEDGLGGNNVECQPRYTAGCWGHRHDTLFKFGSHVQLLMGVGSGRDSHHFQCWTELYESFADNVTMTFVPTVTGLSRHSGSTTGGTTVVVPGYGFDHATSVHVLGSGAHIVKRSNAALTIKTPRHGRGSGHVVVYGNGGTSRKTYAAAYTYRT